MDVTQYDPQAVANAEAQVRHEMDFGKPRRDAVRFLLGVKAVVIADNVVAGTAPWAATVEEYRYLRDLPWDGGQPPVLGLRPVGMRTCCPTAPGTGHMAECPLDELARATS